MNFGFFFSWQLVYYFCFGAFYCISFIRMRNTIELIENRIADYLKLRLPYSPRLVMQKTGQMLSYICLFLHSVSEVRGSNSQEKQTLYQNFKNSKLQINLKNSFSFYRKLSSQPLLKSLDRFLLNTLGEEKKYGSL